MSPLKLKLISFLAHGTAAFLPVGQLLEMTASSLMMPDSGTAGLSGSIIKLSLDAAMTDQQRIGYPARRLDRWKAFSSCSFVGL